MNRSTDAQTPARVEPVQAPDADQITTALAGVLDPELGVDIVSLGMVDKVDVGTEGRVTIGIKLTMRGCPMRSAIETDVAETIKRHPGVSEVKVTFSEMNAEERSLVMERARRVAQERTPTAQLDIRGATIAIASGKGGVGKSSVTANLAATLAAGGSTVGVLDADIWGFSIPQLLGLSGPMKAAPNSDGRPLIQPIRQRCGDGELVVASTGFLVDATTALMWRGLMLNKAVEQFLNDVEWGPLDYLLIDLPPGTGDVQMGLARMLPDAAVVIVTTPATAAQTVAQRAADMARRSFLSVVGVIENMTWFECEHGTHYPLFGSGGGTALAEAIDVPLIAQIPLDPAVSAGNDSGSPVSLTRSPAATAYRELAERLTALVDTDTSTASVGCVDHLLASVEAAFGTADSTP